MQRRRWRLLVCISVLARADDGDTVRIPVQVSADRTVDLVVGARANASEAVGAFQRDHALVRGMGCADEACVRLRLLAVVERALARRRRRPIASVARPRARCESVTDLPAPARGPPL